MRWTVFIIGILLAASRAASELRFTGDGTFKILQLTDLHFGESGDDDGCTVKVQRRLLKDENPDLVVLTGDMVSGYAWDRSKGWFARRWKEVIKALEEHGAPYATVLGNHDDEGDLDRDQIVALELSMSNLTLTKAGPSDITGATNYWLDLLSRDSDQVAYRLWFLDSMDRSCHGVSGWGCVEWDTLRWAQSANANMKRVPALLFSHIPIPEFMILWNTQHTYGEKHERVNCPSVNPDVFRVVKDMGVSAIYSGHDHDNNYYGTFNGVRLAYGQKTGYGSYGPPAHWRHGARVIVLRQWEDAQDSETWISLEDGDRIVQQPSHKSWWWPFRQYVCESGFTHHKDHHKDHHKEHHKDHHEGHEGEEEGEQHMSSCGRDAGNAAAHDV